MFHQLILVSVIPVYRCPDTCCDVHSLHHSLNFTEKRLDGFSSTAVCSRLLSSEIGKNSHAIGRDFPHERCIQVLLRVTLVTRPMVACQPLTTQWRNQSHCHFILRVSVCQCMTKELDWERPWMTHILSNSLPLTVTCPFLGVLCESHWHLDGRVSPVCVRRPAGVRRSQLCLEAAQGIHQAEEKAAAAEDSKCWPIGHMLTHCSTLQHTERKGCVSLQKAGEPQSFTSVKSVADGDNKRAPDAATSVRPTAGAKVVLF